MIELRIFWLCYCTKTTSSSTIVFYYMKLISIRDITHLIFLINYSDSKFFLSYDIKLTPLFLLSSSLSYQTPHIGLGKGVFGCRRDCEKISQALDESRYH